ncbi:MAG: hypothetical protein ACRENB_00055 [Gemmatimonadales bacterium]
MTTSADPRRRLDPPPVASPKPPTDAAPQTDPAPSDSTPESLDKVRDILFGGQMRGVESRLHNLEERFQAQHDALQADFTRRLAELDDATQREVAGLVERLGQERARRSEDLKALGAELREVLRGLEKRHSRLEETSSLADAELRDQILSQSTALSTEITRVAERLSSDLERSAGELRSAKVDRSALAGFLRDVASRLSDDGSGRGDTGD